jgi:hypothetical protein
VTIGTLTPTSSVAVVGSSVKLGEAMLYELWESLKWTSLLSFGLAVGFILGNVLVENLIK